MRIRRMINKLLAGIGYKIAKMGPGFDSPYALYALYSYTDESGAFDYAEYRKIQQEGNLRKIHRTWATEENVEFLAGYIQDEIGAPTFGICHGTRRGEEQAWFRKYLGCEVIGTEISDSAKDFPHTVQWDFHEENPEWLNRADFVYSNSLDHSYDPEGCLNTWINSLRVGGLCILEHDHRDHSPHTQNERDSFGVDIVVMPYLIAVWGKNRFFLKELIDAPHGGSTRRFLIIERRK